MKRKYSYFDGKKEVEREYSYIPVRYIIAVMITLFEIAAVIGMYDCEAVGKIKEDMEETLQKCIEVTSEMLKTNLPTRFIRAVVRIFAPML